MPKRLDLSRRPRSKQREDELQRKYNPKSKFGFFDPYLLGFGTLPEKMVYAALSELGIPFYYLNDISFSDPEIDFFKEYQADFIIPAAKIIIEVQGAYWHSKPAAIESDSYKLAVYESFGYRALAWWDYEIEADVWGLIQNEAGLRALYGLSRPNYATGTELAPLKRTKTDTSQGIRTLNARKKKPWTSRSSRRKLRKGVSSYNAR